MSEVEGFTYQYDPTLADEPMFKEGATVGWVYDWSGAPGQARALKVVALTDGNGVVSLVPDGEWQDVTVVDTTTKGTT